MNDGSPLPAIIALAISILVVASIWKIFTKAGKPGWAALVPVYNLVVLLEIAGKPRWWLILFVIPFVNIAAALGTYIGLARRFGKGAGFGVGLALLGFIFFPVLGFGSARYVGPQTGPSPLMPAWVVLIAVLSGVVPMAAAVAIPAFIRYQKRANSIEAEHFVVKMFEGVRAYYHDPPQADGKAVSPHLPPESVGPTPPAGTCCANADGRCAPDSTQWNHPTWQALDFSMEDPHQYSYQYEVREGGKEFVVRAIGDLDCDGVYSTFEMLGRVGEDGSLPSSSSIRREYESE